MSLEQGYKLGSYEIDAPAGTGGMGEVYKATDTRLDLTVAVVGTSWSRHEKESEDCRVDYP